MSNEQPSATFLPPLAQLHFACPRLALVTTSLKTGEDRLALLATSKNMFSDSRTSKNIVFSSTVRFTAGIVGIIPNCESDIIL